MTSAQGSERGFWWRGFWPLGLLCLITGSRWLLESGLPASASTYASQTAGCFLAAGVWGAYSVFLRTTHGGSTDRTALRPGTVTAAALVVSGAALAQGLAGRSVSANYASLALTFCPLVIALMLSTTGLQPADDLTGMVWPGLAGLAGLLLLLPTPSWTAWRPWAALMILPLLVGGGAVLFYLGQRPPDAEQMPRRDGWTVPVGLLLACGVFLILERSVGEAVPNWHELPLSSGLDAIVSFLTLLALERLGPLRWSSQFFWVPLLALLESLVVLRPFLDVRSCIGLCLLLAAGARLSLAPSSDQAPGMHLN